MSSQITTLTEENLQNDRRNASWDIKNAIPNYISLVLAQGGSAAFSFASVLLLTRYTGAGGYGGVVAVIAASQIALVIVNWTGFAVVRFGVDEFIETGKIVRTFWLRLFVLVPNLLLAYLTSGYWFPVLAERLKLSEEIFSLLIFHFVASAFWIHIQFGLQGIKKPKTQGYLMTVERLLIFGGLLTFLLQRDLTISNAVLCYAVAPLLMTLIGTWHLRKFIFGSFSMSWVLLKKIFAFSIPLLPFSLVSSFSSGYVDALFISSYLSTRDLGIYNIAPQMSGIMMQLPTLANSLLIPMFVTLSKESQTNRTLQFFSHLLPSLTLFWGIFCSFVAFFGYYAIPIAFGVEYFEAVQPFWILLTASVFSIPVFIGYSALSHSASKTYISMVASFLAAIANVFFNFLLIPRYGLNGCAWATVLSYFVTFLAYALLLRREKLMSISWVFYATIPVIVSALSISLTGKPIFSLIICVAFTVAIIYMQRTSLKIAYKFINIYRKG